MGIESLRILKGQDEIMAYLKCGRTALDKFKDLQMPIIKIDGIWWADKENLDKWFGTITASASLRKMSDLQK